MVTIDINSRNNNRLFIRMNEEIVNGYKRHVIPHMSEHIKTFEATHGVKIKLGAGSNYWSHMEFPNEQAYTMALLKWGS